MEQKAQSKMPSFGQKRQTEKVTIDSLSDGWEKRTLQEALDEIGRELGVRERLYVGWIEQGKHSDSDARDRLQRLIKAASVLQCICDDPGLQNILLTHMSAPSVPNEADDVPF